MTELHFRTRYQFLATALFLAILVNPVLVSGQTYRDNPSSYLLPGFGVLDEQWRKWVQTRNQYMAESEVPWIRTKGELGLVFKSYAANRELDEESYNEKHAAIGHVLDQASSDKLTLALIAGKCSDEDFKDSCRERDILQNLIEVDSDNVESYLVAISHAEQSYSGRPDERAAQADNKDIRAWIIEASRAKNWYAYTDTVAAQWYQFNLDFVRKLPPPTAKQRANPDYVLAYDLSSGGAFSPFHKLNIIPDLCQYYARQGEQKLIEACERLANKYWAHHWPLSFSMQNYQLDPFSPESLFYLRKHRVFQLALKCQDVAWKQDKSLWPSMDSKSFEDFVAWQVRDGEWQANTLAAIDDFASFPSRYTINPALCEGMLELDSDAMAELLGDEDPLEDWLANQDIIQAEQAMKEESSKALSYVELFLLVKELDTVERVDDPLVRKIGQQGIIGFPMLQKKLCSAHRPTPLAAAYAISAIDDLSIVVPLLELLAKGRNNHETCETTSAIDMVLRTQEEALRELRPELISREVSALLGQTVCRDEHDIADSLSKSYPNPDKIVIYSNLTDGMYTADCAGYRVEIRNPSLLPKFRTTEFTLAYFTLDLYTLPADSLPMPEFEALFAGRPEALARVAVGHGYSGDSQLWVKINGAWQKLAQLGSWIS